MGPVTDEPRSTPGTMRDLAALCTRWVDDPLRQCALDFAALLLRTLRLEFAYLRLRSVEVDGSDIEATQIHETSTTLDRAREISEALAPWLDGADEVRSTTIWLWGATMSVIAIPIGHGGEWGILVAGWGQGGCLDEDERLVLEFAAGQAATAIRCRRAEEARRQLARSESLLAETQQLAHVGSWSWDVSSGRIFWSDETYRVFGIAPQDTEMTCERFLSVIDQDDRVILQHDVDRTFRERELFNCCYRVHSDDGSMRVVQARGQPVFDADGNPVRLSGTVQDISERSRAEKAVDESRRRFQAVFENALEGILLMDDAGRYVDVNPAICQLLGYTREEFLKLTVSDITPLPDRERLPELLSQFLAVEKMAGEYTVLSKSGEARPGEFRAVTNILPGLHLAIHRDITERERAEEALRQSEERFRFLAESIPHMVWAARPDGHGDYQNAQFSEYVGLSPARLNDNGWAETLHPDDHRRAFDAWEISYRQGAEYRIECRIREGKTGSYRWFLCHALPQRDAAGQIVRWFGTCTDIDQAKRSAEELNASAARLQFLSRRIVEVQEEERRHLARELHDEIGQVLSAISVNLHHIRSICNADSAYRIDESIGIIDQAIQQVRNLSLDLRPPMLDDLGLVATVRWYVDRQAQRSGFAAHFSVESSAGVLAVELTVACFRVVQEALTNVVRHARARHVWIELRQSDDQIILAVRDDGTGFDAETTLSNAGRDKHSGLLGIRERVELLGGRSDIRSQTGHGTSIQVWLPIVFSLSTQVPSGGLRESTSEAPTKTEQKSGFLE
jgi:PAS domain S-box-containing protein